MEVSAGVDGTNNAQRLKERGNEEYNKENYKTALEFYTKAIKCTEEKSSEKAVCYKNRAAAHLKMNNFSNAIDDTTKALAITPNDPKALFRRCLAYEGLKRYEEAYKDATAVLTNEPNNKAVQPILSRLHDIIQKKVHEKNLMKNKVNHMIEVAFNVNAGKKKRENAFNNILALALEKRESDVLWCRGITLKLVNTIKTEKDDSIRTHAVKIISELLRSNVGRVKQFLNKWGIPWFLDVINSKNDELVSAVRCSIQTLLNTLIGVERLDGTPDADMCETNKTEIDKLLTGMAFVSTSRTYSGLARDSVVELIARNVHHSELDWAKRFIEIKGIHRLLEIAGELSEYKYESSMEITENTQNVIAVCLLKVYENMGHDQNRQKYASQAHEYLHGKLLSQDVQTRVRAATALTTLLTGPMEVGNSIVSKEGIIDMILAMADTNDVLQQKVACECLIAAASRKDKVATIVRNGAGILKKLYTSKETAVKVRALVGLCKLAASGGTDASIRPFSDGATSKLAEACRKFLVHSSKDKEMKRWAAEGLSYLTLDATVKEKLIEDKAALHALLDLAKTGDQNVVFGVVTTLVNLSNAYEREEIIPEMLELARFAKYHVPQLHELDDPDFVAKRLEVLVDEGITSALVALTKTEGRNSKELISRIFNAICGQKNLRGMVVQQGGAKALIQLATDGTDRGKRNAAQALARIGVTINPEVCFPGQRMFEIIRPLINLLHPDCSALENFEALLTLCNIAAVSRSARKRIVKEDGVSKIESYMFENHVLLRRAATQAMANLVTDETVVTLYEQKNDRVKFLFLLCFEEDDDTVEAASGALAMLTPLSPICCKKVMDCPDWFEMFEVLLSHANPNVKHRGIVVITNIMESDPKLAHKIMSSNVSEMFIRLTEEKIKKLAELAENALKVAERMNVIQINPIGKLPIGGMHITDDPKMPKLE